MDGDDEHLSRHHLFHLTSYSYYQLQESSSVRLLRLSAEDTREPWRLACTLHSFPLLEAPTFQALSYTWGPPYDDRDGLDGTFGPLERPRLLEVDGFALMITRNLFDALCVLRSYLRPEFPHETSPRVPVDGPSQRVSPEVVDAADGAWLWVDAICINQDDKAERSSQVILMGQVYSRASKVIAWLGTPSDGIDDFVWATTLLHDALESRADPTDYRPSRLLDPDFHQKLGITDPWDRIIGYIRFFVKTRWFTRSWVLQEIILAQDILMFCGTIQLDWTKVCATARMFREAGWEGISKEVAAPTTTHIRASRGFSELASVAFMRDFIAGQVLNKDDVFGWFQDAYGRFSTGNEGLLWLLYFLDMNRGSQCTDNRDKIYSVLGVAGLPFSRLPPDLIVPDYNAEFTKVYIDVTILLLNNLKTLDILSWVGRHADVPELESLPSWVADYSRVRDPNPLGSIFTVKEKRFNASRFLTSEAVSPRLVTRTNLTCTGGCFDVIGDICQFQDPVRTPEFRPQTILQFVLKLPVQLNGNHRTETFWRTLMADTSAKGERPAPPATEAAFKSFLTTTLAYGIFEDVQAGEDEGDCLHTISGILDEFHQNERPNSLPSASEVRDFYDRFYGPGKVSIEVGTPFLVDALRIAEAFEQAYEGHAANRRLAQTKRGLLCLGPDHTEPGDQIWLIKEARTPYILRPVPNTRNFILIGDCYVHNFMYGEMLHEEYGMQERIGPVTIV